MINELDWYIQPKGRGKRRELGETIAQIFPKPSENTSVDALGKRAQSMIKQKQIRRKQKRIIRVYSYCTNQ